MRSHAAWDANNTMRSDWNFDTIKSMSALGTISGTVNDLLPSAMVSEDNELFDDSEVNGSIDSKVATNGSDTNIGIGMNLDAAHSTVIIKAPHSPAIDTTDETLSGTALYLMSCRTLLIFYFRCAASLFWISTLYSCIVRYSYVC